MKSNTFNILIQLYIEQILSGAKSYLASHPELGVPLGVFNYKHEPNYEARVKSIKKLGLKGNKFSLHLAEILRIKTPIPSFLDPAGPNFSINSPKLSLPVNFTPRSCSTKSVKG